GLEYDRGPARRGGDPAPRRRGGGHADRPLRGDGRNVAGREIVAHPAALQRQRPPAAGAAGWLGGPAHAVSACAGRRRGHPKTLGLVPPYVPDNHEIEEKIAAGPFLYRPAAGLV